MIGMDCAHDLFETENDGRVYAACRTCKIAVPATDVALMMVKDLRDLQQAYDVLCRLGEWREDETGEVGA